MDTEYFAQHIQCPREGKQECLHTVQLLAELAFVARSHGLLRMEETIRDTVRYADPFLRKAVMLVIEIADPNQIRKVLENYIFSSGFTSSQRFLNCVLITETMLAISHHEDIDYIFHYLVPSLFGLEYEIDVLEVYRASRQAFHKGESPAGL